MEAMSNLCPSLSYPTPPSTMERPGRGRLDHSVDTCNSPTPSFNKQVSTVDYSIISDSPSLLFSSLDAPGFGDLRDTAGSRQPRSSSPDELELLGVPRIVWPSTKPNDLDLDPPVEWPELWPVPGYYDFEGYLDTEAMCCNEDHEQSIIPLQPLEDIPEVFCGNEEIIDLDKSYDPVTQAVYILVGLLLCGVEISRSKQTTMQSACVTQIATCGATAYIDRDEGKPNVSERCRKRPRDVIVIEDSDSEPKQCPSEEQGQRQHSLKESDFRRGGLSPQIRRKIINYRLDSSLYRLHRGAQINGHRINNYQQLLKVIGAHPDDSEMVFEFDEWVRRRLRERAQRIFRHEDL